MNSILCHRCVGPAVQSVCVRYVAVAPDAPRVCSQAVVSSDLSMIDIDRNLQADSGAREPTARFGWHTWTGPELGFDLAR